MSGLLNWLRTHKFNAHLIVFALLFIPPIPLYFAAQYGAVGWIWALLSVGVLGNILILLVR